MPAKNPPRNSDAAGRKWELKEIEELLDLLARREITEFEMEQLGVKIRVKRGPSYSENPGPLEVDYPAPRPRLVEPPPASLPAVPSPHASSAHAEPAESTEGLHIQKSPIVGTFYGSPSPDAPPFVKVGDVVKVGQVLCIIEAMKLMNDLEAEVAGEIVRIYVENGQPVEYGQSLFAIKPSHKK